MGPLHGLRVIEMAGIGPAPFCAMLLADMGATVLRVDRMSSAGLGIDLGEDPRFDVLRRGRKSIALDLKKPEAVAAVKRLVAGADVLIEGFRPGVMERLGLGPEELMAIRPSLVYGRMTGFGQDGPEAERAGHDINYIALSGVLNMIGRRGSAPVPPLNLVGDFGGGAMFLAFGVLAALYERNHSHKGQVVDAAMVEGAAYLSAPIYGLAALGLWSEERGANILDSGAPWYDSYETADGKFIALGSIEEKFFQSLLAKLGVPPSTFPQQMDRDNWPVMRSRFAEIFRSQTRSHWCEILGDDDTCVSPVLTLSEAPHHPHNVARGTFIDVAGVVQPAPAPRFSRSRPDAPEPAAPVGVDAEETLTGWGLTPGDIDALHDLGALRKRADSGMIVAES